MPPVISIIIPTLREEQFLERTLANLDSLKIPHEIIITDGGSQDRTLDIARAHGAKITVWDQPRRQTFGEAKNAGAKLATGEFLVFIDADVLVPEPEKFFEEAVAAFRRNPKLTVITVPYLPYPENTSIVDHVLSAPFNWFNIISNNIFHYGSSGG